MATRTKRGYFSMARGCILGSPPCTTRSFMGFTSRLRTLVWSESSLGPVSTTTRTLFLDRGLEAGVDRPGLEQWWGRRDGAPPSPPTRPDCRVWVSATAAHRPPPMEATCSRTKPQWQRGSHTHKRVPSSWLVFIINKCNNMLCLT